MRWNKGVANAITLSLPLPAMNLSKFGTLNQMEQLYESSLQQQQQQQQQQPQLQQMCLGYYSTEEPYLDLWEIVEGEWEEVSDVTAPEWEEISIYDDDWSVISSDDIDDGRCLCGAAIYPDWPCVCSWRQ